MKEKKLKIGKTIIYTGKKKLIEERKKKTGNCGWMKIRK